jgi:hypothetical protein
LLLAPFVTPAQDSAPKPKVLAEVDKLLNPDAAGK